MTGNPFAVDQTYVVSVKALEEILKKISTDQKRWWINDEGDRGVVISFNAGLDTLNTIQFEFPEIANVVIFPNKDGKIICLYPVSRSTVQRGLYLEDDQLLNDEVRDWETFWPPIQKELAERYLEGSGIRSMSINSSSSGK